MSEQWTMERWLDVAVSGVRFKPDRQAVREELAGHLEDRVADLRRIFPDIPEAEARERALAGMGDAQELKISLAKVHRPWLGYLWQVSRMLAAALLTLALVLWGSTVLEEQMDYWKMVRQLETTSQSLNRESYGKDCYQSGIDPWRADGPYPEENTDVIRTPLAALRPEGSVWTEGYRIRVERAGLFHFQDGPEDIGDWWLFAEVRTLGLPWEPLSVNALWQVRAVDSGGNEYASSYEVYELGVDHDGYVMVNSNGSAGLEQSFDVEIIGMVPGAEWVRLEYDHMGKQWSLTIPLEVEGGRANG